MLVAAGTAVGLPAAMTVARQAIVRFTFAL